MTQVELEVASQDLAGRPTEEVVAWALGEFGERIALASSFGAEDVVIIDILSHMISSPRVFAIDTGRLHEATYEVMERVRERYHVTIEVFFPRGEAVEQLEREEGFYSFRSSLEARHACCAIRKVEPLRRALSGLEAWITGLRREQNVTRAELPLLAWDAANGLVKVNPLADWTWEEVWNYIRRHKVPYNRLHDEGFPSIGCAPCTRAVKIGEHPRAGRWWWESPEHKECGLHLPAGVGAPVAGGEGNG